MFEKKGYNIIIIVASIGLLYLALRGIPLSDIWATIRTADSQLVALAFVLLLGHYTLRALRWQLVVSMMGYSVPFYHLLIALLSGNLANLVVPGTGELTRCGTLQKTDGVPISYGLSSVVAERSYDLLMMAFGIGLTALVEPGLLGRLWATLNHSSLFDRFANVTTLLIIAVSLLLLVGIMVKILAKKSSTWIIIVDKAKRFGRQFIGGLTSVNQSSKLIYFILYTLVLWLVGILTYYIILLALPISRDITLGGLLTFYSFVSISGIAAPTQGGVGSFHIAAAYALSLYGLTYPQAVIVASFIHAVQMAANLLLNVLGVGALSLLIKRLANSQPVLHENQ
ncbi:lysylphosphatidylglycerol synthase transmembrane domain-containing protein [Spirosoma flavum]|uniref:Lysylphosphatidylglycerol synthase transmembrane domain-containing protein n=1 Tax=Spirosoma flavum TaxID=2048557 RepID=A0ABW6AVC7_9BACT